jgi:hypothetical protein
MGKNIVILGVVAVAAYIVGSRSVKSRGKNYEDLRHQVERLWSDPHARRSRRELAKKAGKALKSANRTMRRRLA